MLTTTVSLQSNSIFKEGDRVVNTIQGLGTVSRVFADETTGEVHVVVKFDNQHASVFMADGKWMKNHITPEWDIAEAPGGKSFFTTAEYLAFIAGIVAASVGWSFVS